MKKFKILASFLATLMLVQTTAFAFIDVTYKNTYEIAKDTYYTEILGETSAGFQSGHFIEYTPSEDVSPVLVYGDSVNEKLTIAEARDMLESEGKTVIGGINGDFYVMATGVPIGVMMADGEIISSDAWQQSVGFKEDGSTVTGVSGMNFRIYYEGSNFIQINYFNKTRTSDGVYLLNEHFDDETNISTSGTDIIFERMDDTLLSPNSELMLRVIDIRKTSSSMPLLENQFVLTIDDKKELVPNIEIGDEVKLIAGVSNTEWNDVVYAIGADQLLISDGEITEGLPNTVDPRSAIGIKEDGTVVLFEIDGRQTDSRGLSLNTLAQELLSYGCVYAVNLDGGGSSSFMAKKPGYDNADLVNTPSSGSMRYNSNFLMFVNNENPTNDLDKLHIYPAFEYVLKDSYITVDVKATDDNFHPVDIDSDDVSFDTDSNLSFEENFEIYKNSDDDEPTIIEKAFIAEEYGQTIIEASIGDYTGEAEITVLDNVDIIDITDEDTGTKLSRIITNPGDVIDLKAEATYKNQPVSELDTSFTWEVSGDVGTIDEYGVFTASETKTDGEIIISYGENSEKRLPVSISLGTKDDALVIDDFEDGINITGENIELSDTNVAKGYSSLKVSVDNLATLEIGKDIADYKYVNVYIKNSPSDARAVFLDENGEMIVEKFVINGSLYSVNIPENAKELFSIEILTDGEKDIYVDHITLTKEPSDETAPKIVIDEYTGTNEITGTIIDDENYSISKDNIKITLNGENISFAYDETSGLFKASDLVFEKGINNVKVEAFDNSKNLAKSTIEIKLEELEEQKFTDISENWAKDYINYADGKGIVTGELKDEVYTFSPSRNLTRAEFAVIISRYLGLETEDLELNSNFSDLDEIPSWALPHISAVSNAGIMKGSETYEGLFFNPTQNITRAEVMTVLGRTLENGYETKELNFTDLEDIPSWSYEYFEVLVSLGTVNGYSDGTIKPNNNITRAEVCKMIFSM